MQTTLHRIHIIGGPGTGKSTLARQLGAILNLPVYELDTIAFEGLDFHMRPALIRAADVHQIAQQPEWITEGIFVGWISELLDRADVIVWLDGVPWHRAMTRIAARFVRSGWTEMRRRRGIEKFFRFRDYARHMGQLVGVAFTSRTYYHGREPLPDEKRITRAATMAQLAPYEGKVIRCENVDAANKIFAETSHPEFTLPGKSMPAD